MVIESISITYAHPRLSTGYRRDCPRPLGGGGGRRPGWVGLMKCGSLRVGDRGGGMLPPPHLTVVELRAFAPNGAHAPALWPVAFRPSHSPSAPLRTSGARTPLLRSVVPPYGDIPTAHCTGTCRKARLYCPVASIKNSNSHLMTPELPSLANASTVTDQKSRKKRSHRGFWGPGSLFTRSRPRSLRPASSRVSRASRR